MTTIVTIHHANGVGDEAKMFDQNIAVGDAALAKVLFDFNVTGDARVTMAKALMAASIQLMLDHQEETKKEPDQVIRNARMRAASVAITQLEITQMCAVKAFFAKA